MNIIFHAGDIASWYLIGWCIFFGICESFFSDHKDLFQYKSLWLQRFVRFTGLFVIVAIPVIAYCNTAPLRVENVLDFFTVVACWTCIMFLIPFLTILICGLTQFLIYLMWRGFLASLHWAWRSSDKKKTGKQIIASEEAKNPET